MHLSHQSARPTLLREVLAMKNIVFPMNPLDEQYQDALNEAKAERVCSMGVGCGTAGKCYARAHGEPDRCGSADGSDPFAHNTPQQEDPSNG